MENGSNLISIHSIFHKTEGVKGVTTKTFLVTFVRCFKSSFLLHGDICNTSKFNILKSRNMMKETHHIQTLQFVDFSQLEVNATNYKLNKTKQVVNFTETSYFFFYWALSMLARTDHLQHL